MKIIQNPISENHKSAMFFHGVVATEGNHSLVTYQDGELLFMDNEHIGAEIRELGQKGLIDDNDIENEDTVDIHVDKFFAITTDGANVGEDDAVYCDYDEAIEAFEEFLEDI